MGWPLPTPDHRWVRWTNLALAVVWATMIPISILTGWIYSIPFIAAASIYANFITHVSAWRADIPNPAEPAVSAAPSEPGCDARDGEYAQSR
jgi:hypothetical protein